MKHKSIVKVLRFLMDRQDGISFQELHGICKGDMGVINTWADMCRTGDGVESIETKEGLLRWRTNNRRWKEI